MSISFGTIPENAQTLFTLSINTKNVYNIFHHVSCCTQKEVKDDAFIVCIISIINNTPIFTLTYVTDDCIEEILTLEPLNESKMPAFINLCLDTISGSYECSLYTDVNYYIHDIDFSKCQHLPLTKYDVDKENKPIFKYNKSAVKMTNQNKSLNFDIKRIDILSDQSSGLIYSYYL